MPRAVVEALLGTKDADKLVSLLKPVELVRLAADLRTLRSHLSAADIRRHYVKPLLGGDRGVIAEAFSVARLASGAVNLTPHVPTGVGNKNYDARAVLDGVPIALEVKRQGDKFPFNSKPIELDDGLKIYERSRPGADPRFLDDAPPNTDDLLPGSSIFRDALEEAAAQLPLDGTGIIALCADVMSDFPDDDVIDAILGDDIVIATRNPEGPPSNLRTERLGNGVFAQSSFSHVAAVWCFRFAVDTVGEEDALLCRWAFGIGNPNFRNRALPDVVDYVFPRVVY